MSWFPKQKVVVPIDFSDDSFAALQVALDVVDDPAHLHIVHVLQPLSPMEPGQVWDSLDEKSRIENVKQALRQRLSDAKYREVQIEVLIGDPGHEIADLAEHVQADLIVLPSHGRRGLTRLLIGSVAERVIRLAHCPVLVLRT